MIKMERMINVVPMGVVKKTVKLPFPMVSAFAIFISSIGPNMIATSIGESGKSCLFKKKPISPKNNATNTSNRLSLFA